MSVDVTEVLTKAWKAVQDAKIPGPLQELALGRAIDLLTGDPASKPADRRQQHGGGETDPETGAIGQAGTGITPSGAATGEDDFYEKMSEGTGVSKALLERLVHIHDNAVHLLVKTGQLPKENAAAQKVIALLISVGTHYWTGSTEVDMSLVRAEAEQFNRVDTNFNKNVDKIQNITLTGVRGGSKKIKIRRAYIDSFKDELQKYGQFSE